MRITIQHKEETMTNKTLMSIMLAGACVAGVANTAEAHPHHHGDKTAQRIGATGMLLEGVADVIGAVTGQPKVVTPVVAPVVATPAIAVPPPVVTPVVVPAPVVAPVVTPIVAPAPVVLPPPPPPVYRRPPLPLRRPVPHRHPMPLRHGRGCR